MFIVGVLLLLLGMVLSFWLEGVLETIGFPAKNDIHGFKFHKGVFCVSIFISRVFQFNSKSLQLPTKCLQLINKFRKKNN